MRIYKQPLCPFQYKWQLVKWASKYFGEKDHKFNKMKKKQLYALWFRVALK